jgi:hypothetical protein
MVLLAMSAQAVVVLYLPQVVQIPAVAVAQVVQAHQEQVVAE